MLQEGYESEVQLPDGRCVWLQRKMFTWAIVIGSANSASYDNHWCYETRERAEQAMSAWNPLETAEPDGWIRNPQTGRRRPNGDASQEYVNW